MEKIQLTCSSCGGKLIAIETKENTYVCTHCGNQEIITKEASKQNYYINQNIVKNIYGKEQPTEEDYYKLVKNAEKFMGVKDYLGAIKFLNQAVDIDPGNYLAWWIRVKAKLAYNSSPTENLLNIKRFSEKNIQADYDKAYAFADNNQKAMIAEEVRKIQETTQKISNEVAETPPQTNLQKYNTSASFGTEVSLRSSQIISMIFAIISIICCIAAITALIAFAKAPAGIAVPAWGASAFCLFLYSNTQRLKQHLIKCIKNCKQISSTELIKEVQNYQTTAPLIFRGTFLRDDIDDLLKCVKTLIINNNLIGYKIEDGYIIDDNFNHVDE